MTEDEAKTKVCCGPLHTSDAPLVLCQGSACMAWRDLFEPDTRGRSGDQLDVVLPMMKAGGFCGLAGKP